jgi:hypothetical protein
LGLLKGNLHGFLLILFGIVARFAGDGYRLGHFGVYEISMVSFASAIHKVSGLKVSDEFSNFSWHLMRIVLKVSLKVA